MMSGSGLSGEQFELAMFPLEVAVLPYESIPLQIFEPRYIDLLKWAKAIAQGTTDSQTQMCFGTVMIARGREVGGEDIRNPIGVILNVDALKWSSDGTRAVLVATASRSISVQTWLDGTSFHRAMVAMFLDTESESADDMDPYQDLGDLLLSARNEVGRLRSLAIECGANLDLSLPMLGSDFNETVWRLCSMAPVLQQDRYELLKAPSSRHRLELLIEVCKSAGQSLRFRLE